MTPDPTPKALKLAAQDKDDLTVIASVLQDAVVLVGDMAYEAKRRRFAFMASRFMWEANDADRPRDTGAAQDWRVRCGVHFDGVLNVRTLRVPAKRKAWPLELLTIECAEGEDGAAVLDLIFANGAQVRLDVECIDCHLQDVGDPYLAVVRPVHDASAES
jgi:Protein of unknown function (DUF2948)